LRLTPFSKPSLEELAHWLGRRLSGCLRGRGRSLLLGVQLLEVDPFASKRLDSRVLADSLS
jgi:hypothetical protein